MKRSYKKRPNIKNTIRNMGRYIKQSLAIKFSAIVTGTRVSPTDLDSFTETNSLLIVGESKHTDAHGDEALNTVVQLSQSLMMRRLKESHKAFTWYQFGNDKATHAIIVDCPFLYYARHDESYHPTDDPTENAYIVVSLYHQLGIAISKELHFDSWLYAGSREQQKQAADLFHHLVECAIWDFQENEKSLIILHGGQLKQQLRKDDDKNGFYQANHDLIQLIKSMTIAVKYSYS